MKVIARDCLKTVTTEDLWLTLPDRMKLASSRLQESNLSMGVKVELQKLIARFQNEGRQGQERSEVIPEIEPKRREVMMI